MNRTEVLRALYWLRDEIDKSLQKDKCDQFLCPSRLKLFQLYGYINAELKGVEDEVRVQDRED